MNLSRYYSVVITSVLLVVFSCNVVDATILSLNANSADGRRITEINEGHEVIFNCIGLGPTAVWRVFGNRDPVVTGDSVIVKTMNIEDDEFGSAIKSQVIFNPILRKNSGAYTCTIGGSTRTVRISVLDFPPNVTTPPDVETTLMKNKRDMVTLSCTARGYPRPTIFWSPVSGLNRRVTSSSIENVVTISNLNILNISLDDAGIYKCSAVNERGMDSASFSLTIYSHPELIIPLQNVVQETFKGSRVNLTCSVRGNPKPSITWSPTQNTNSRQNIFTNTNGDLSVTSTFIISSVLITDSTTYICTARNNVGVGSVNFSLLVFAPAELMFPPGNISLDINEGKAVTFSCVATGNPVPFISWSPTTQERRVYTYNNLSLRGLTVTSNLSLSDVSTEDTGLYTCVAYNLRGTNSAYFNITVNTVNYTFC